MMKRSMYRVGGALLCSLMAALSLYLVSRLSWVAIPLGLAALVTMLTIGRASILAVALTSALMLIGFRSDLPYYIDLAASHVLSSDETELAGSNSLRGRYLLNSGFLGASRQIAVVEGEIPELDDFQRRSAFYIPELSRGACRNDIIRITSWGLVVDSRCQDGAGSDK